MVIILVASMSQLVSLVVLGIALCSTRLYQRLRPLEVPNDHILKMIVFKKQIRTCLLSPSGLGKSRILI